MILSVTEILIVQRAIGEGSSLVTLRLKTRYVENKKLLRISVSVAINSKLD